jgi:hypothetical protein
VASDDETALITLNFSSKERNIVLREVSEGLPFSTKIWGQTKQIL